MSWFLFEGEDSFDVDVYHDAMVLFSGSSYILQRFPPTDNHSLKAVSAADQHLLNWCAGELKDHPQIPHLHGVPLVLHDRFGALSIPLAGGRKVLRTLILSQSQEHSIKANLEENHIAENHCQFERPFSNNSIPFEREIHPPSLPSMLAPWAMIRIPKSLELWEFYLEYLVKNLHPEGLVGAGFMTKYFTPKLLKIAQKYFHHVHQGQAWKKSRILFLSHPKEIREEQSLITIERKGTSCLQQLPGVFSSQKVDDATTFLLETFHKYENLCPKHGRILDLGCGNGVIAQELSKLAPNAEIHGMDDQWLAVLSAQFNCSDSIQLHWEHSPFALGCSLAGEPQSGVPWSPPFQMIVTNPPFHLEHEIDLSLPLRLFFESRRILEPGGSLIVVGNRHLNYSTHLQKAFASCRVLRQNKKFEILQARV
ncbi:MAG: methyltransferase [Spirochaetales bacterium]|nr:methyltransferase [Spirochaetales bacterium]